MLIYALKHTARARAVYANRVANAGGGSRSARTPTGNAGNVCVCVRAQRLVLSFHSFYGFCVILYHTQRESNSSVRFRGAFFVGSFACGSHAHTVRPPIHTEGLFCVCVFVRHVHFDERGNSYTFHQFWTAALDRFSINLVERFNLGVIHLTGLKKF